MLALQSCPCRFSDPSLPCIGTIGMYTMGDIWYLLYDAGDV